MPLVVVNNFSTTLGAALGASTAGTTGQTLTLATGAGANFPVIAAPNFAFLTITEGTNIEVVKVTAHVGTADTLTVTRGIEGVGLQAPTAVAYTTAAKVQARLVKMAVDNFAELDATETYTGIVTFAAQPVLQAGADVTAGNVKLSTTGQLEMADQTSNPSGVASKLLLYSRNYGGRRLPKWVGPFGTDYFVQDALWESNTVLWKPGATTGFTFLGDSPTITGTITTPTAAAGSFGAEMNKRNIASAATAGTAVGLLGGANQYARIAASGHGGFFFFCRFRVGANTASSYRVFLGLSNQGSIPITDPSAGAFSMVGIGYNAADTTLFITLKDGTTANRIAVTGSNKTAGSTYDCAIFCPPGNGSAGAIFYRVDDVNAGTTLLQDSTTGTSTNAPLAGAMMRPVAFVGTSTAVVCNLELVQLYCSSDY